MIFENMTENDCNLRLSGSFVMLQPSEGSEMFPVYVRGMECIEEGNESGYYDSRVHAIRFRVGDNDEVCARPYRIIHDCVGIGYLKFNRQVAYLSRIPERQTKTGLPAHSTVVFTQKGSYRLEAARVPEACAIAGAAYNPSYDYRESLLEDGMHVLGPSILCDMRDGIGRLFGPQFSQLGRVEVRGRRLEISTQHPLTIQRMLA